MCGVWREVCSVCFRVDCGVYFLVEDEDAAGEADEDESEAADESEPGVNLPEAFFHLFWKVKSPPAVAAGGRNRCRDLIRDLVLPLEGEQEVLRLAELRVVEVGEVDFVESVLGAEGGGKILVDGVV